MKNLLERYTEICEENQILLEQLKLVAKNLTSLMPEQPAECVFGYGYCNYPINDCYNCPMHSWSDFTPPLTTCEFK